MLDAAFDVVSIELLPCDTCGEAGTPCACERLAAEMSRKDEQRRRMTGANNPNWKGGQWVNSKGYVMILVGRDHPMANCRGYAPRYRVILYETKGPPEPGQHGHHVNEIKDDDRPDNLEWRYPVDHGRHHLTPERAKKIGALGGKKAAKLRRRARRQAEVKAAFNKSRRKASQRRTRAA